MSARYTPDSPEQWKPVPGFPSYEVSSLGEIVSYHRGRRHVMAPWTNKNGYLYLTLCVDGTKVRRTLHSVVAEAFHGARPAGQVVRHLDGNYQNNTAANLCFGSASENSHAAVRHGTHAMVRRTHCPHGHEYTPENTRLYQGRRFCKACQSLRAAGLDVAA